MVHDRDWFALYRHKDETSGVVTCLKVPAASELVTRGVVSPNGPCLDPTEAMPCLRYAYLDDLHLVLYLPGVQKLAVKALASKRQNMASLPVVTVLASPARDPALCNAVVTAVDSLLHLDAGAKETMKTELKAEFRHRCEVQTAAHVVASQGLRVLREAYVRRVKAIRGHRAQEQELRHMCDGLSDMDCEFDAANLVAWATTTVTTMVMATVGFRTTRASRARRTRTTTTSTGATASLGHHVVHKGRLPNLFFV